MLTLSQLSGPVDVPTPQPFKPVKAVVRNEGCDLHYWYQGQGPLIIFVPGGNGHGRQFNDVMAALSADYTCATFDRRQMSQSQPKVQKRCSPPQQARDIRAVIKAVGFDKAIIFGSSSGGLFSFQFAHDFPEMVEHLISHEASTPMFLPDATDVFEWCQHLIEVYETHGQDQAAKEFEVMLIGYDAEGVKPTVPPPPENPRNFWKNEFAVLSAWAPNLLRIKEHGVSVGVMRGIRCRDAIYARSVVEQAKILNCEYAVVPGHHQGFECEVEEFVPYLLDMLRTLERKRHGS